MDNITSIIKQSVISLVSILLTLAMTGCSISDYIGDNSTDKTPPVLIEKNVYNVKMSENREQWNHPNILVEPRINFSLESPIDKTKKESRRDDDNHVGVYSLRLDGSDFRTVLTPEELLEVVKYKITDIDYLQRSHDNRYLGILSSRGFLDVIDLETKERAARIKRIKHEKFYWLKDTLKILFMDKDRQILVLDITAEEGKQVTNITDRFRTTEYKRDYEYYADINKLAIFTDYMSVYNFATGALLEQSSTEYYYGEPSANSAFRIDKIKKERSSRSHSNHLVFYRQGQIAVAAELPYKTRTWSDGHVDFGPNYIYKDSSSGMYFDSLKNTESRYWKFEGYKQARAITVANPLAASYAKINCGTENTFCDTAGSWEHHQKKPSYSEVFNELDSEYRFGYEERQPAIEKIIKIINEFAIKEYQAIDKQYVASKNLTSLTDLDEQAKVARDLFAQSEFLQFAKNILNMSNQLNTYMNNADENDNTQQSEIKKIIEGNRLFSGMSEYDINTNLATISKQCLKASEDPIKFLSWQYYLNDLSDGFAYGSGRNGIREGMTRNLEFIIPHLVKAGYKKYARKMLDDAREVFGSDLVVYLQLAKGAHENDYKDFYGDEYNAVKYMIMYDLVGDKQRLKDLIRNTKEEIYSTYKSEKNTLARKRYFAKKLASFYLAQGNKKKADKVLKHVAKKDSIQSFLYRDDDALRQVYSKVEVPSLQYWKEFIAKSKNEYKYEKYRYSSKFKSLLHNYGDAGVKRAYQVLPMLLAEDIISNDDVTGLKMHMLEHLATIKHPAYPKLLAEMETACQQQQCGLRYADQWTLRLMHNIYKTLGKKQKLAEIIKKMRLLEEGGVVDLSNIKTSNRGYSYYYVMDETAPAEDVINHIKQNSNNSDLYEGLMEVHAEGKNKQKHLAYLKEMIKPKFWPDTPGRYLETILPELMPYVQKDPDVIKTLADTSCGLIFDAHFRHNPDHFKEIRTSF